MLGDRLKFLRRFHGMSQEELAKQLNVSKQCISNWENYGVTPSIEMLCKIAKFFNTTTDYVLGMNSIKVLDVSKLTDTQVAHLNDLIRDLEEKNK